MIKKFNKFLNEELMDRWESSIDDFKNEISLEHLEDLLIDLRDQDMVYEVKFDTVITKDYINSWIIYTSVNIGED